MPLSVFVVIHTITHTFRHMFELYLKSRHKLVGAIQTSLIEGEFCMISSLIEGLLKK